jgi:protocatechuate 3,4-dioxygenase beta subunit
MTRSSRPDPGRRLVLRALVLAPVTALAAPAWAQRAASESGLIAANVCMLTPQATEGPYYIDPRLVRADITEGRPGVRLDMALQVVSGDCVPIEGARVDLWHCDAQGNYSGFARQGSDGVTDTGGETFLRGTLLTDAGGVALFHTIYPGWYRGRTAHLHYKVFLDSRSVLTSQVFLPDTLSDSIYERAAAYAGRPAEGRVRNGGDSIAMRAGAGAFAAVKAVDGGFDASLVVGVDAAT